MDSASVASTASSAEGLDAEDAAWLLAGGTRSRLHLLSSESAVDGSEILACRQRRSCSPIIERCAESALRVVTAIDRIDCGSRCHHRLEADRSAALTRVESVAIEERLDALDLVLGLG